MNFINKNNSRIIIVAIILCVLCSALFYGCEKVESQSDNGTGYTVTLSVRCDTILDNMHLLDESKHGLVPSDGVIFPATTVTFSDGESVFDILKRTMQENKIHLEFVNTPVFDSAYIEGINNLYELDVGELSGWTYKVNDVFPGVGCSQYILKDGDVIEVVYTCNLGKDVGNDFAN